MIRDLIIIVTVYLLLCPIWSMPLYEKLLFFPSHQFDTTTTDYWIERIGAQYGAQKHDVFMADNLGRNVHGWLFVKPGASKVILVSHGNAGNISNRLILASALLACNASVLLYDYTGYGQNLGTPTLSGICQDGLVAYDHLVFKLRVPPADIIVYGESIGTGVACTIADSRIVGGIILQSGFPSLLYAAHDRLWFTWLYPDQWFANLDNLKMMRAAHKPLLIIHGDQDKIFPPRYAVVLEQKASEPKQLLKISTMGHTVDDPDEKLFHDGVSSFVEHLSDSSEPGATK